MPPEGDEMVTFRLAPRDRAAIQRLVDNGEFRNRSDFLRYAVKTVLSDGGDHPRARLDLDLEGVDLPAHTSARGKPARRQGKGVNL